MKHNLKDIKKIVEKANYDEEGILLETRVYLNGLIEELEQLKQKLENVPIHERTLFQSNKIFLHSKWINEILGVQK